MRQAVHRFIRVLLPVADVKYGLSWRAGGPPFHTRLRLVIGIGHTWRTVSLGFAIETLGYYRVTSYGIPSPKIADPLGFAIGAGVLLGDLLRHPVPLGSRTLLVLPLGLGNLAGDPVWHLSFP